MIRSAPGEQLEKNYTEAIDIGTAIQGHATGLLRTQIVRAAQRHTIHGQFAVGLPEFGNTEVAEYGSPVAMEENVGRLDITMNDPFAMGEIETLTELFQQIQRVIDAQLPADTLLEAAAFQVFHRDVMSFSGLAEVMDGNDVAVAQRCDESAFVEKAFGLNRAIEPPQQLECDWTIEGLLPGQVHGGHPALRDQPLDPVARNPNCVHAPCSMRHAC